MESLQASVSFSTLPSASSALLRLSPTICIDGSASLSRFAWLPARRFTESTEDRESLIESVEIGSQFFGVLGLGIGLI